MGQVTVTLNGRTYRLRCGDGEEPRLIELANDLSQRIDTLAAEFGQVGDDRLLVMAALLVTDELFDARARLGGGVTSDVPAPLPVAGLADPPWPAPQASVQDMPIAAESGPDLVLDPAPGALPPDRPVYEPGSALAAAAPPPPPPPSLPLDHGTGPGEPQVKRPVRRQSLHERLAEAREQPFTLADRKTGSD